MSDEDESGAFSAVEVQEELEDGGAVGGVEVARGLVCQDDRRAKNEGTGEGDTLLLAAGELDRIVVEAVSESDVGKQRTGAG